MELHNYKTALALSWVLVMCTAGIAMQVTSLPALAALTAFTLLPPVLMLRFWKEPPQTLSESIREARR